MIFYLIGLISNIFSVFRVSAANAEIDRSK